MVKVVANGYKITHGVYTIEIDVGFMTKIFVQSKVGKPLKLLETLHEDLHPIDCLFRAINYIYEYNKRHNKPM